jgi:diaminopimelate decarboxylase
MNIAIETINKKNESQEKRPWVAPVIVRHAASGLNKFGGVREAQFRDEISGVKIADLVKQYGSPLFVISEEHLRQSVRRMRRAFTTRYPKVRQAWSYKTNYLDAVCSILHQEGCDAEVVSAFEYDKARKLGVPGSHIFYNGPHKPRASLSRAMQEGAHIHIDHLDELAMLEDVALELGIHDFPVTLRLNFDTGFTDTWSRFGFNLENGQAMEAARRIAASPHLKLTGLHNHIGTFIIDTRAYAAQVNIMIGFMEAVEAATGCTITSLDIGGGFASRNALQGSYLPPEQITPTVEQYAEAICGALAAGLKNREEQGKPLPELILESGRAIVDEAEWLISSVVANKRLPDGRRAMVVNAGVNLLFTAFWYNHEVRTARPVEGIPEETVIYGPLCMNIDVMRQSIKLPPLKTGDLLSFWPVGAYNNTQWMQFIAMRPAVVMVRQNGRVDVVRESESLEDITALEHLPAELRKDWAK